MPLKIPGSKHIKVPKLIRETPFMPFIEKAYITELACKAILEPQHYEVAGADRVLVWLQEEGLVLDPAAPRLVDDYYLYLTIHASEVRGSAAQRNRGAHVDGFQDSTFTTKVHNDHSMVWVNVHPTLFTDQDFDAPQTPRGKNWNYSVNWYEQMHEQTEKSLRPGTVKEYEMFSAYQIHDAAKPAYDSRRLFVRMEWNLKRYFSSAVEHPGWEKKRLPVRPGKGQNSENLLLGHFSNFYKPRHILLSPAVPPQTLTSATEAYNKQPIFVQPP